MPKITKSLEKSKSKLLQAILLNFQNNSLAAIRESIDKVIAEDMQHGKPSNHVRIQVYYA
jgi:hypothetical protein